jgi:hypothetical protein
MSYFIGLDPGSRAAGVASLHEDGGLAHITLHEAGELPDRLVSLRAGVRGWLAGYAEIGTWCCVIEQPGTRFGGSALLASFGVCVEAARSVLRCPVMTPTSAAWKKADVMVGARLLGYEGACQDTADAIVMADAARVYARQVMGAR